MQDVERFARHLEADRRSRYTIKQYVFFVSHMLDYLKKEPKGISGEDLERFKAHLAIDLAYSKNSICLAVCAVRTYFKFLKLDASDTLSGPKRPASVPNYIPEADVAHLLEIMRPSVKEYALLCTLAYTGMRVGELCSLTVDNLDFNQKTIRIRSGKGDKDRVVILDERVEEALKAYLSTKKKPTERVFISRRGERMTEETVQRIVRACAKKAGIARPVTPHVLRHSLATHMLRHGADIRVIQRILGHSSIATTQIYTYVDTSLLKETFERSKPKY
jgi:integrase/recombinase XerD